MTEQPVPLNKSEPNFPKGIFTYTVGDVSPVVEFDGQGRLTITLDGEVIVTSTYKIIGDVFEVLDEAGLYADPESGIGRYKWSFRGKTLTFSLIEDKSKSRRKSTVVPFNRME
ncbi:MAG: hypothetical protein A2X25_00340 [Chloroflexi bacterium GWB2_49_20]|nr:MAG: hypothetical protein A2X25_00340 [Chloroflexi bacterium GWB2_49_20]OGN79121.1 MAG: hypothetical protein A2X26_06190 [Chloroflexi bacterium GWC2_49_37]OGN84917.1 MAG: hypothetical protein A2X27_15230 [Chloroflexi bacterium GWD2_49_16]HCC78022.1 hypothetical protein [Anaerolineae bacterium]HCM96626.1 hypothetical protein [Anaerolineae bacterium]